MVSDFLSLIFPCTCIGCNDVLYKREGLLCGHCRYKLPKTNYHLEDNNPLYKRFWGKVPIRYAFSYLKLNKGGSVQKILYKIKYGGMKEVAYNLGSWYGKELLISEKKNKFDLLVSVPMHKRKLKIRGYNQSEYFAEGLASILDLDFNPNILERISENSSQTLKSRFNRWVNVKDIYKAKDTEKITGKHILIVDDVLTTGATFEACARELLDKGAKEISIVALASAH